MLVVSKKSESWICKSQEALQDWGKNWSEPNPASEHNKTQKGKLSQEQELPLFVCEPLGKAVTLEEALPGQQIPPSC